MMEKMKGDRDSDYSNERRHHATLIILFSQSGLWSVCLPLFYFHLSVQMTNVRSNGMRWGHWQSRDHPIPHSLSFVHFFFFFLLLFLLHVATFLPSIPFILFTPQ